MIDQQSGYHEKFLRTSDLRLDDCQTEFFAVPNSRPISVSSNQRAHLIFIETGGVVVKTAINCFELNEGDTVALENGVDFELSSLSRSMDCSVLVSSVGADYAFIKQLHEGVLLIGVKDTPFSSTIAASVNLLRTLTDQQAMRASVIRRINEIMMLSLIHI